MTISGSAALQRLWALSGAEREAAALEMLSDPSNVPAWMWQWRSVRWSVPLGGKTRAIEVFVTPDWLALGDMDDWVRVPLWPATAQKLCTLYSASLPTRFISDRIWEQSTARSPMPIVPEAKPKPSPKMETTPAWRSSQEMIQKALPVNYPLGSLVAGPKKDVVFGPSLDGSRVAIYGARWPTGAIIQPYSTIHQAQYSDYSHGIRLVLNDCFVDGQAMKLNDVCQDKDLWPLVSNQGPFPLSFPNVYTTSATHVTYGTAPSPGSDGQPQPSDKVDLIAEPPPGMPDGNPWHGPDFALRPTGNTLTNGEAGGAALWATGLLLSLLAWKIRDGVAR